MSIGTLVMHLIPQLSMQLIAPGLASEEKTSPDLSELCDLFQLCSNVWQLKETCLISGHAGLRPLCCLDVFVQAFFSVIRLSPLWFWLDSCLYQVFGEKFQERGWEMREGALYGVLFLAGLQSYSVRQQVPGWITQPLLGAWRVEDSCLTGWYGALNSP